MSYNNTPFLKGYSFPRPLISKLSIISALQNKYNFISLTVDIFQNNPELFKKTATNLIYILQTGISFKKDALLSLFDSLLNSKTKITKQQAENILENHDISNTNFIEIQSLILLYAYYMWVNNDVKYFEPAMKGLNVALQNFQANPKVYYSGTEYNFELFKPLCYNINGDNLFEFIPYFCFVLTFYSDSQPYKFFEEIGSETSYNNLLTSINNYFGNYYRGLLLQIGLENNSTNTFNEYSNFITTIFSNRDESGVKIVKEKLQHTLNTMLDFNNIIKLRNDEMNKSISLLEENFNDQNRLSDDFLKECYLRNMDSIVEILIESNPLLKIISQYPNFQSESLSTPFINYDLNDLTWMTHYCLSGGNHKFYIDENYNYGPILSNNTTGISLKNKSDDIWKINSKINKFKYTLETPFSDCDFTLQSLTSFIKQRIIAQQENFLNTPDLNSTWTPNEDVNVTLTDFNNENNYVKLMSIFLNSLWILSEKELDVIIPVLFKTNSKFKSDIENLMNLYKITSKIYPNVVAGQTVGILLLSYLKDLLIYHLDFKRKNQSEITLNDFNLYNYLMEFIVTEHNEEIRFRINKLYNMSISINFITKDSYARFVNTCSNDFMKYLSPDSYLQLAYLKGNDDNCDITCIGGLYLYDQMIDPNSFNRGYNYMRQTTGINENIEVVHQWTKKMENSDVATLLNNSANNNERFKSISYEAFETLRETFIATNNIPILLQNYNFNVVEDNLIITFKNVNDWEHYELELNGTKILITQLLIQLGVKQTSASYTEDIFTSKCIQIGKKDNLIPGQTVTKGFKFNEKLKIPVSMSLEDNSKYMLPLYKYQSQLVPTNLIFANPPGYNLIQITLNSSFKDKNNVILLFTKTTLENGFNYYSF